MHAIIYYFKDNIKSYSNYYSIVYKFKKNIIPSFKNLLQMKKKNLIPREFTFKTNIPSLILNNYANIKKNLNFPFLKTILLPKTLIGSTNSLF